jgi:hypothetical protein
MSTGPHRGRKRAAVAAALLVAAALAAFYLLRGREERAPAAPRAAAVAAAPAAPLRAPAAAPDEPPAGRPDARPLALVAARAVADPASPAGSIEGRVVSDASGDGVAGAELVLSLDGGATTTLTTDGQGGFRFRPARAGAVAIASVTADGYLPFAPEWGYSPIELVARPGVRVTDVVIYLAPATEWLGVVLAPDGSPVAGAEVRIVDTPAAEQELVAIADRFTTDRRGEFRFRAPEGALLEARARGYGPARAAVDEGARAAHKLVLRLAAGDPGDLGSARITGVVVDGADDPLAGVLVSAQPEVHGIELVAGGRALTGDDGRFAIERLDPRAYRLEARDQVHAAARAEVVLAPGQVADVRLQMTSGAVLAGTVRDTAGVAVPAFTVVVSEVGALGTARPAVTRTFVDADGAFAIDGLEAGDYTVQATAHGHAPSRRIDGSAVAPPARPGPVAITLPAGGTLTGLVRKAGAGPIEGARVITESGPVDGSTAVPFSASATTGADGRFTLRGLAPGRRSVHVSAARHHGVILGGLEVSEGATLGPVEVSLRPLAEGEEPTTDLVGIGAGLSATDDALQVTLVVPGGGAAAAGLAVGDRIESIDGRSVVALGFDDAIQAIRGPIGTTVRLAVRRASSPDAVVELVVPRLQIRV